MAEANDVTLARESELHVPVDRLEWDELADESGTDR